MIKYDKLHLYSSGVKTKTYFSLYLITSQLQETVILQYLLILKCPASV